MKPAVRRRSKPRGAGVVVEVGAPFSVEMAVVELALSALGVAREVSMARSAGERTTSPIEQCTYIRDVEGGSRMAVLPFPLIELALCSESGARGVEERDGVRECERLREDDSDALSTSALPAWMRRRRRVANSDGRCVRICCLSVDVVAWWGFEMVSSRSGMEAEKRIVSSRSSRTSAPDSVGRRCSINVAAEPRRLC